MSPVYPDPEGRHFRIGPKGAEPVDWLPLSVEPARHGYVLAISPGPERAFLVRSSWGIQELVPERVCGPLPLDVPAGEFFQRFTANAALDLEAVQQLHGYVGYAQYPSGWIASPWMIHEEAAVLCRALRRWLAEFHGEPTIV